MKSEITSSPPVRSMEAERVTNALNCSFTNTVDYTFLISSPERNPACYLNFCSFSFGKFDVLALHFDTNWLSRCRSKQRDSTVYV